MPIANSRRRQRWRQSRSFSPIMDESTSLRATRILAYMSFPSRAPDLEVAFDQPSSNASTSASIDHQRAPGPTIVGHRSPDARTGDCSACWTQRSWLRSRSGPCPRRRRPAEHDRRPDPCRAKVAALIAATCAALNGRRSPSWLVQQFSPAWPGFPIRFMARYPLPPATGSPWRCLSVSVVPADRFLTPLLEPEATSVAPVGATEDASGSSRSGVQKATSRLRSPPSIAGQVNASGDPVQAEAWPSAMNADRSQVRPCRWNCWRPIRRQTFGPKLWGMFRRSLGRLRVPPPLCPRQSGLAYGLRRVLTPPGAWPDLARSTPSTGSGRMQRLSRARLAKRHVGPKPVDARTRRCMSGDRSFGDLEASPWEGEGYRQGN